MSNRATVSRSHPAPPPATLARFATPRSRTGDDAIMREGLGAWMKRACRHSPSRDPEGIFRARDCVSSSPGAARARHPGQAAKPRRAGLLGGATGSMGECGADRCAIKDRARQDDAGSASTRTGPCPAKFGQWVPGRRSLRSLARDDARGRCRRQSSKKQRHVLFRVASRTGGKAAPSRVPPGSAAGRRGRYASSGFSSAASAGLVLPAAAFSAAASAASFFSFASRSFSRWRSTMRAAQIEIS